MNVVHPAVRVRLPYYGKHFSSHVDDQGTTRCLLPSVAETHESVIETNKPLKMVGKVSASGGGPTDFLFVTDLQATWIISSEHVRELLNNSRGKILNPVTGQLWDRNVLLTALNGRPANVVDSAQQWNAKIFLRGGGGTVGTHGLQYNTVSVRDTTELDDRGDMKRPRFK